MKKIDTQLSPKYLVYKNIKVNYIVKFLHTQLQIASISYNNIILLYINKSFLYNIYDKLL